LKILPNEQKNSGVPPSISRQRRPVDVLKYANDIVEHARKVESGGTPKEQQPSPNEETTQSRKSTGQPAQPPIKQQSKPQ